MRFFFLVTFFAFSSAPLIAAEQREVFYGTWGSQAQCAQAPIKRGGTVLAQPFEIRANWMRQGQLWCSLKWGPLEVREKGYFTAANAQCGEDSVLAYFLGMELSDNELTLRWDLGRSNGPLRRCSKL